MDYTVHGILQARILEWLAFSLLQGIFPSQGLNPGLPHCRRILYQMSHKGSPKILEWIAYPFSSGSSPPRNQTDIACIAGKSFTNWAIREAPDKPVHPKGNQSWMFIGRTDVEAETPILWPPDAKNSFEKKRPWCWEILRAGGEGDNRGWDGWMASPTQWTWVWVNSGSWWWTGRPDVPQSMGLQRAGHDWATELNWTD